MASSYANPAQLMLIPSFMDGLSLRWPNGPLEKVISCTPPNEHTPRFHRDQMSGRQLVMTFVDGCSFTRISFNSPEFVRAVLQPSNSATLRGRCETTYFSCLWLREGQHVTGWAATNPFQLGIWGTLLIPLMSISPSPNYRDPNEVSAEKSQPEPPHITNLVFPALWDCLLLPVLFSKILNRNRSIKLSMSAVLLCLLS